MANKPFNTRVQLKNDTETNWNQAVGFSPLNGELIVYRADATHNAPRLKVGDGTTNVNNLPFVQMGGLNNLVITSTNSVASDAITAAALTNTLQDGQLVFVILNSAMEGSAAATIQFGSTTAIPIYRTNSATLIASYAAGMILGMLYYNNKFILLNGALTA